MTLKLKDPSLLETRGYVNGVWLETEQTFPVHNPSTGALIANVSDISIAGTSDAIDAAYAAKAAAEGKAQREAAAAALVAVTASLSLAHTGTSVAPSARAAAWQSSWGRLRTRSSSATSSSR